MRFILALVCGLAACATELNPQPLPPGSAESQKGGPDLSGDASRDAADGGNGGDASVGDDGGMNGADGGDGGDASVDDDGGMNEADGGPG